MSTATVGGLRQVAPERTSRVEVTLTDHHEEVDAALRLVHDGFVASGFMRPRASGRRMVPSFLHPGTTFAVARVGGVVHGTVALIPDGPFGLPADGAFGADIDTLRRASPGVVEVGCLSLLSSVPRRQGPVLAALIAALLRLLVRERPDHPIVIAVSPSAERFYRSVVGLDHAAGPCPLLGAPAILMTGTARRLVEGLPDREGVGGRRVARLVHGSGTTWLSDGRRGQPWPADWLTPLLDEVTAAA